jgi:membrane-bound lytic murein transglycosylase F
MKERSFLFILATILLLFWQSCSSYNRGAKVPSHPLPDSIVVGTLYSPTGFFIFRGDTMGYDYDRIQDFVKDKNIKASFKVARSMTALIDMLVKGEVDVLAYSIPNTAEYKKVVLNCGTPEINYQVLVQPKSSHKITDVTQLVGKDVYVEGKSKYESRLKNLDGEIGGGIKIHSINNDTLITEDLIELVSKGKLPLTIVDDNIARLNSTYYNNIDISLKVSFPQRSSWAVSKKDKWLADSIDAWSNSVKAKQQSDVVLKRYFELSKNNDFSISPISHPKGEISHYDYLFKKYAKSIGWDWRLLAAIACTESGFNSNVVSWSGARGIMQIMPSTGRTYGLNNTNIAQPDANIRAAVHNIKDLNSIFRQKVPYKEDRIKFILAAYNSGAAHIIDAIALADKYNYNPRIWDDNVEQTLLLKSNPKYYNDPVCRWGYFRGRQTVSYVSVVMNHYKNYQRNIKR